MMRTIAAVPASDRRTKRQRANDDPIARYFGQVQAEVMAIFWERESATVRELVDELNRRRKCERRAQLAYTTVLTLVTRLWSRDFLVREPEGRGFRYRPARSREELLGDLSDELIDRLLDDFGAIAVARLGSRLDTIDASKMEKLKAARKKK